MKRIFLNLFRSIEQKNKQQLINELLTLDSTIEESVQLFEKVKADFLFKLSEKENQLEKEAAIIKQVKSNIRDPKIVIDLYDINVTDCHRVSTEKAIY